MAPSSQRPRAGLLPPQHRPQRPARRPAVRALPSPRGGKTRMRRPEETGGAGRAPRTLWLPPARAAAAAGSGREGRGQPRAGGAMTGPPAPRPAAGAARSLFILEKNKPSVQINNKVHVVENCVIYLQQSTIQRTGYKSFLAKS